VTVANSERVGFIGLGIMGSRMAACLRRAGFELVVWNRTRATADAWAAEHGATVAESPAEVGAQCGVVITMVVDGDQVRQVLLGDDGVARGAAAGTVCIDCSTIAPGDAREIAAALAEREIAFMDAPVSGSSPKAENGTLTIMVGAEPATIERTRPHLEAMGELIVHVGPVGHGQTVKVINQAVAATNAAVVAQALVYGKRAGVDLDALVEVMGASSGASTMLALKARPMIEHDYETLFKLEHMLKDVRLCLEEGQAIGAPFPAAGATRELYTAAEARGHGEDDFAAVLEAVEGLANTRL
jgi:3-hydroxyisobutyrate dehydrogenase